MKRVFFAALLCFALTGVAVIAAEKAADQKTPTTKPATPINKFCAVEKENPVDATVPTYVYKGQVIGFCCEDCLPKFKKDPEFYMKGLK